MATVNPFIFLILIAGVGSFLTEPRLRILITFLYIAIATICIPFIQLSDNVTYEWFFKSVSRMDIESTTFEIGYYLSNRFLSQIINYDLFRALYIFFILSIKIYLLSQFTKFIPLALVFYFAFQFYVDSYLIRASLAASLVALALVTRFKGRPVLSFFLLIASISMHISAIAVIPLWIIVNLKMTKKIHITIFLSLLAISQVPIAELVVNIIGTLFPNYYRVISLMQYVGSTHGESIGILRGSVLMYSLIHLFFIFVVDRGRPTFSYQNNFVLNCMLFAITFLLAFNDMVAIGDRISRYTILFYAIGLTIAVGSLEKRSAVLVYFLISCISVLAGLVLDEGPYRTV